MISVAALSDHGAWWIGLAIALVAALAVTALLAVLVAAVQDIKQSVNELLDVAGKVATNSANIPQLEATAPVLSLKNVTLRYRTDASIVTAAYDVKLPLPLRQGPTTPPCSSG